MLLLLNGSCNYILNLQLQYWQYVKKFILKGL